jgi:VIT1/CCC1 family predicted Fe2+/Mn2+ transporter
MRFPLSTSDIGLWLAVTAIILLITSELLFSSTGRLGNVAIEKKRLRLVALGLGIAFMATVIMRIYVPV